MPTTPTAPTDTTEPASLPEAVLLVPRRGADIITFCKSIIAKTEGMPRPLLKFGSQRRRDEYPMRPSVPRLPPCLRGEP